MFEGLLGLVCVVVQVVSLLSAGSADHHGLDLADAFDLAEFGFEFVYDACFIFGEFYLNEKGN